MANNQEQLKTLLFELIFNNCDIDKHIERSKNLIKTFEDMILENENNDKINDKEELLKYGKVYHLFALYHHKFYLSLKICDIDKCLKINKLIKPLLTDFTEHSDKLADNGLNNNDYLDIMNTLKYKYDQLIEYEQIFYLIKDILKSI